MEKLAIITGGFLPVPATKGGAVENLIQNYMDYNEVNYNFDITIFSDYDNEAIEEANAYKNTNVIFVKSNFFISVLDKITFFIAKKILKKENSHSYRFIFKRLNFMNKVSKMLKKNNYDKILLENHPTEYLTLKWRKNYLKYKNRYYYHCHNEFPGTYGCKDIILNTKKIICVSQYIADSMSKYLKLNIDKFDILRNGIEVEKFQRKVDKNDINNLRKKYNIDKEEKVLIFTGRIVPEKGIKELLEAIRLVKNNNFKLLIIGSALNDLKAKTKYQSEIETLIKPLGNKVIFTGYISYSQIHKYYSLADVAVLPSIWDDPAPLTIIESLTCGLPIITTNSGGIPEYATNGSAIILNRDNNLIENLAHSIDYLLENDKQRTKMQKICKEVSKDLTAKNYFNTFCKYMEE